MGIKEDLAAQRAEFVSLRALLEAVSADEGVTLQEAATWLAELLREAGNNAPDWCEMTPGRGIIYADNDGRSLAWAALDYVVSNGKLASTWDLCPDEPPF